MNMPYWDCECLHYCRDDLQLRAITPGNMGIGVNIGIIFVTYLYLEILGIRATIWAAYSRNTRRCEVVLCHYLCRRSFIYLSPFDCEGMP